MIEIYKKIVAFFQDILGSNVNIIVANQNAPRPPRPVVTIKLSQIGDLGKDRSMNLDEKIVIKRWLNLVLTVQIFARPQFITEAEEIAQKILDGMHDLNKRIFIMGRDVAFTHVVAPPSNIDEVLGSNFEPRVIIELGMTASREHIILNDTAIEEVESNNNINV